MGRGLVALGVVLVTVASLVVFLTRSKTSPREQLLALDDGEPRVILDDFAVYRYKDTEVVAKFSAKLGHFLEPNLVETYAAVNGIRYADGKAETLRCEAASALFNADEMHELFNQKKEIGIASAHVEDRVRIGLGEHTVRTEHARYIAKKRRLVSKEPVQVDGPNRTFIGEDGFSYNLKKEKLSMPGQVKGVVDAKQFQNQD